MLNLEKLFSSMLVNFFQQSSGRKFFAFSQVFDQNFILKINTFDLTCDSMK